MAANVLKAIISVQAPGAKEAFASVSNGAKETGRAVELFGNKLSGLATGSIAQLQRAAKLLKFELSNLTPTQLKGDIGIGLTNSLKAVNAEMKVLNKEAGIAATSTFSSLSKIGGPLRTLANILPGIGVAGLFTLAFQGIGSLVDSLTNVSHKFSLAKADAEAFNDALKNTTGETTKLQALVSIARDVTLSTNQRKNALDQLQKLYPDYLRNITLENINSDAARKSIDELTSSIIKKGLAEAFSKKVVEETLKFEEKKIALLNQQKLIQENNAEFEKQRAAGQVPANALKKELGLQEEMHNKLHVLQTDLQDQDLVVEELTNRYRDATVAAIDFTKTPKLKNQKTEIDDLAKSVSKFDRDIHNGILLRQGLKLLPDDFLNFKDLKFNFSELDTIKTKIREISDEIAFQKQLEDRLPGFSDPKKIADLEEQLRLLKQINTAFPTPIFNDRSAPSETSNKRRQKTIDDLEASSKKLANTVGNIAASAFTSLFDAIAAGESPVKAFFKTIIRAVEQLIAKMIALKVAQLALKLIPGGGVASKVFNIFTNGFAEGGAVSGGKAIVVGEKGPELFVPSSGGQIIPNNALGGGMGSFSMGGSSRVVFEIAGNNLIGVLANAGRSQNRLV